MPNEIECTYEHNITCPYCGWEDKDSWESGLDGDGDSDVFECPRCDKKFSATKDVVVTYSSNGLCTENGIEHIWEELQGATGKKCITCGQHVFDTKPNLMATTEEDKA